MNSGDEIACELVGAGCNATEFLEWNDGAGLAFGDLGARDFAADSFVDDERSPRAKSTSAPHQARQAIPAVVPASSFR